jgi:hypothetical protein
MTYFSDENDIKAKRAELLKVLKEELMHALGIH